MMSRIIATIWLILLVAIADIGSATETSSESSAVRIATFDIDATPPVGFTMAYDRVRRVDELGLRCRGIVLLGSGAPMVVCAVDWIGIGNEAHDIFRGTIAKAAGTTRERVAVQTLHQHDAPRCDFTAERLLNEAGASDLGAHEGSFARDVLKRLSVAVAESISVAQPVTHAAIGEADVHQVASNRRIQDETGRVVQTRYTACRDPNLRALPEGTIDPVLTTISFYSESKPLAVLSYYACHPQSYYRTGVPSPDFPGIARFMRGQDVPDVLHVHFNGAGGNIGAGKYNDGSKENRLILAQRVADGMKRSFESATKFPFTAKDLDWSVAPVALPVGKHLDREKLRTNLTQWNGKDYWGSPEQLAWLLRCESGHKIDLSCLRVGKARVLHMPGELFVEYQLAAKQLRPDLKIAMAAYGDYGPGYIGTDISYGQGGYETSGPASKVAVGVEKVLMDAVKKLLAAPPAIPAAEPLPAAPANPTPDFSIELPRIPPTAPKDTLETFDVATGYKIELVASEPLIGSPVAVQWDADGRMYVCEMRGYSENREDKVSTIGLLTDTDHDGVYDQRSEFVGGLMWPTAIFPFRGGLFVGDAPNLYYFKDTDGDGKADTRKTVLTGFGTSNVQGLMNSMRWGLDNQIHVACSSAGGQIQIAESDAEPINIRGRDLAFDPNTFEFTPTSGAAQHGMCFDDWGRKFASSNSDHIMQVMYEDHEVARNPLLLAPPARISIAADGPQAEVFRISPVEPWRVLRTRLRVAGSVPGPIEGGGRAAGYFTGATGITIYRGDAWPEGDRGIAIVGDVGSNLVHRKKLSPNGLQFIAARMDANTEFVRSTDIWFRPAQFANAPDGSLHVIDFCREVIEHPKSLPPSIKQHLDLTAGRDRGRIYRVVPDGYRHRPTPNLQQATIDHLISLLSHPNAWHRETASRLLFERQDKSTAAKLRRLIQETDSPLARMHALYALAGQATLRMDADQAALERCLADDHPQVQRHAIRLAARHDLLDKLCQAMPDRIVALADSDALSVRYQLAFAIGEVSNPFRDVVLAKLIRRDVDDRWMQVAVQSSLADSPSSLFADLIADRQFRSVTAGKFLTKLAAQIQQQKNATEYKTATENLSELTDARPSFALPIIGQLTAADKSNEVKKTVTGLINKSIEVATNPKLPEHERVQAIDHLSYGTFDRVGPTLAGLIDQQQPQAIQRAAIQTLDSFADPEVVRILIDTYQQLTPPLRNLATNALLERPDRAIVLFDAINNHQFPSARLSSAKIEQLAKSKNRELAWRAAKYLKSFDLGPRGDVVDAYKDSLQMAGDVDQGRTLFKKVCAACHRAEGVGHELGPNLAAMKSRGPESILINVLDPNREVNPQYLNYAAVLTDGRVMLGMVTAESANGITLDQGQGKQETILRSEIEEFASTRVSIMPEGMEDVVNQRGMADIIAYLMQL